MKRIRFLIDIRRHRGDSNYIIGLINRFMADLPVAGVEWLIRPDQVALLPQQSIIGQADPNDPSCANVIASRLHQFGQAAAEDLEYWVLSYDGNVLITAEKVTYMTNLRVKTKHLGELMKNSWSLQKTNSDLSGAPVAALPFFQQFQSTRAAPVQPRLTVDEAVDLAKAVFRRGEYTNPTRALPQKYLRGYLSAMDGRAAKILGDYESETLVKNLVARGCRAGLARGMVGPVQSRTWKDRHRDALPG